MSPGETGAVPKGAAPPFFCKREECDMPLEIPELKFICVLPDPCRQALREALTLLGAAADHLSGAEKEAVQAAPARIREVLAEAGAEEERCPECGGTEFYAPSYCNFAHCLSCGAAIDPEHGEDCWVPPEALRAEMAGDIELAVRIMQGRGRRAR